MQGLREGIQVPDLELGVGLRRHVVVVRADMDDELAYNVTKGIVENVDTYKAAHRLLNKVVTLQTLTEKGQAPFHPGAEKYLREKGLIK